MTTWCQRHSDARLEIKFPELDTPTRQCLQRCSTNAMETLRSGGPAQSQEAQLAGGIIITFSIFGQIHISREGALLPDSVCLSQNPQNVPKISVINNVGELF